ncbi:IclR family transcriptional regulator [Marinococcus halophilus]|uniref:IclR family transcriptional regulator n=1 Tax=Marinococcus halophilus TaxID=1371 RepID=A0A510Y9X7_MARHA|nr:IclR family transcriptional regulator C-terminal domain-containing protein [Marinococcus halophilus]OZT79063.1 IclR family transcriptional regulator [Marinococcus halophilus]GEK59953.1 IclR family transcriptional regulator [Marinococcus halophilus]
MSRHKMQINPADRVQSLEKGLAVIQSFSQEHPTLTVSHASKLTGLNRPTVRRIMLTLEALGFVQADEGHYSLTAKTLTLGYAYLSSQNLWNFAYPKMREFVQETGESCSISVLEETDIIYVARVPAKRIMSINIDIGTRLPAYATSMGRVLLAHLNEEQLEDYWIHAKLDPITDQTITNMEALKSIIHEVRINGYAHVENQLEQGLRSLAVPLTNRHGETVAAINCSVHAGRITEEVLLSTFLPLLRATARGVSNDIIAHRQ